MEAIGKRRWTIAGGHIPLGSNGMEPEFTSRDEIAVLNCSDSPPGCAFRSTMRIAPLSDRMMWRLPLGGYAASASMI